MVEPADLERLMSDPFLKSNDLSPPVSSPAVVPTQAVVEKDAQTPDPAQTQGDRYHLNKRGLLQSVRQMTHKQKLGDVDDHDIISSGVSATRYQSDFEEIEFLGKGGFGEVVKAKNRIDGRFYAVKKIRLDHRSKEENRKILREVQTLSRLTHTFVVRYYQAWLESGVGTVWHTDSDEDDNPTQDDQDYLESSLYVDQLRFGSENAISGDNGNTCRNLLSSFNSTDSDSKCDISSRRRSSCRLEKPLLDPAYQRVLYIQMEYCEKKSLKNIIAEGVDEAEAWRIFKELLEGLAYIHSQGMIHRDLKPSNSTLF